MQPPYLGNPKDHIWLKATGNSIDLEFLHGVSEQPGVRSAEATTDTSTDQEWVYRVSDPELDPRSRQRVGLSQ
jgi:hypothetical protein